jgi:hypothetical protein
VSDRFASKTRLRRCQIGYRAGSVTYCRPDGVIQRKAAGVSFPALPPEMLFEPTVMAALRTAVTYARPARAAVDSAPLASQLVTVAGNPAGPVPRL